MYVYLLLFTSGLHDDEKLYVPLPCKISIPSHCGCMHSTYYMYHDMTCACRWERHALVYQCLYMHCQYYNSFVYVLSGCFHCASVTFCSCQSEATTLIYMHDAGLFPCHTEATRTGWFEALMLECQVSAHAGFSAFDVLTDSYTMKVLHMHLCGM